MRADAVNRNRGKSCRCSFLCIFMQPYLFSFSPGIDKGGQSGGYGCRGRRCAGGSIGWAWAYLVFLLIVILFFILSRLISGFS